MRALRVASGMTGAVPAGSRAVQWRIIARPLKTKFLSPTHMLAKAGVVPGKAVVYMARCEQVFEIGTTRTFEPGEKHWFQAGPEGAVLYSFSSVVRDAQDGFTDPAIECTTRIVEDRA